MTYTESVRAAVIAAIVGDALGVPVESSTRAELALSSVKNMLGFGRYDMPQGTWSDDASMILCTMESLTRGYTLDDLGRTFCEWIFKGLWTPSGFAIDAGFTTVTALESIRDGSASAATSGAATEDDNGNGSLMRMLPAALYFSHLPTAEFLARIHEISAITHAHPRALIGCGIYALYVRALLATPDKTAALRTAVSEAIGAYSADNRFSTELMHYTRIISLDLPNLLESTIESSGYVVHTLEAALWCFLKHGSTKEILLAAVNLGLDTDTTGTIAGGLAGLVHGLDDIPGDWLDALVRKSEIDELTSRFAASAAQAGGHA